MSSNAGWPQGPVIAATDYIKAYADQIRPFMPGRYKVLGRTGSAVPTIAAAAPVLRGRSLLRRGRRAEGACRRPAASGQARFRAYLFPDFCSPLINDCDCILCHSQTHITH